MDLFFRQFLISEVEDKHYQQIEKYVKKIEEDPAQNSPWFNDLFNGKIRIKIPSDEAASRLKAIETLISEPGGKIDWETGRYYGPRSETSIAKKLVKAKAPQNLINWVSQLFNLAPDKRKKIVNPETEIVISRHPVDVLRMGDVAGVGKSCHSPDGSYFNCAITDAKTGNMVAYLIEKGDADTEQSKWMKPRNRSWGKIEPEKDDELGTDNWSPEANLYNFEKGELFSDKARGVKGPAKAIARLRIRRFEGKVKGKLVQLAVPEARVYPDYIESFHQAVLKWAQNTQKDILDQPVEDLHDFNLVGGEYLDTDAGELLRLLFGKDVEEIMGSGSKDLAIRIQQQEMKDIADEFSSAFKHVKFDWELKNAGNHERHFRITIILPIAINFSEEEFRKIRLSRDQILEELKREFPMWLNANTSDGSELKFGINRVNRISVEQNVIGLARFDNIYEPQEFREFLEGFKILDKQYDRLRQFIIQWMIHPSQKYGQHNIMDIVLKYFDEQIRGEKKDKHSVFILKGKKPDWWQTISAFISGGLFQVRMDTKVGAMATHLAPGTFKDVNVDEDYSITNINESPWKEIKALFPTHPAISFFGIHCDKRDYVTPFIEMNLPLTADDATAEEFMKLVMYLNKIQPYVMYKTMYILNRAFGDKTSKTEFNYWQKSKKVEKPQSYDVKKPY